MHRVLKGAATYCCYLSANNVGKEIKGSGNGTTRNYGTNSQLHICLF